MLATTATANQQVTADVARQLGEDTVTLRGSLARSSLGWRLCRSYVPSSDMPGSPRRCGRCQAPASCTCSPWLRPSGWLASCSSRVSKGCGVLRTDHESPRAGGVYGGKADPLPMMSLFDNQIQLRMGQANVKRWIPGIMPLPD